MTRIYTSIITAAAILLMFSSSVLAYRQIIDLGTLGSFNSEAYSINENNQIVGWAHKPYGASFVRRACLFDSTGNGDNIDLDGDAAYSINENGRIVGVSDDYACLFNSPGNINLGTLGGNRSSAYAINDAGRIVGDAELIPGGDSHACLFRLGANIDLGTLGGCASSALSINNSGQIAGWALDNSSFFRACLFDDTGGNNNIDLGTLGGLLSEAHFINDAAQIVGRADTASGYYHACLFDQAGNIDLGTLGGLFSTALGINDEGQIVGSAENSDQSYRACLFDPTGLGRNIDLNLLIDPSCGWQLNEARAINNNGYIVGWGMNPDWEAHAFLLVPEPATLLLFTLALPLGRGFALRKKL